MMRRALAVETCLVVMLAFLIAPFQHVHPASGPHGTGSHEHAESGIMHAHFYVSRVTPAQPHGVHIEADDDGDHAHTWQVDTFTVRQPSAPALSLPLQCSLIVFAPERTFDPVAEVEQQGHDPPQRCSSSPRAPPL